MDEKSYAEEVAEHWIRRAKRTPFYGSWKVIERKDKIVRLSKYQLFQEVADLFKRKRIILFGEVDGEYDINTIRELYEKTIEAEEQGDNLDIYLTRRKKELEAMADAKRSSPKPIAVIPRVTDPNND